MNLHRCKTAAIRAKKNAPFIAWLIPPATPTLPAQPATLHCRIQSFALVMPLPALLAKRTAAPLLPTALPVLLTPVRIQQGIEVKEEINPVEQRRRARQGGQDGLRRATLLSQPPLG